jgi:hypothetical protein
MRAFANLTILSGMVFGEVTVLTWMMPGLAFLQRTHSWRAGEHSQKLHDRGLHSSTFQLNLSPFYGIGGARRGCVARVKGLSGGI